MVVFIFVLQYSSRSGRVLRPHVLPESGLLPSPDLGLQGHGEIMRLPFEWVGDEVISVAGLDALDVEVHQLADLKRERPCLS